MANSLSDVFMMMMEEEVSTNNQWGSNHQHCQVGGIAADDDCSDPEDETHRQSIRLAKGLAAHNMRPLPDTYVLGENDVICGRGRRCFNHIGNQRFRKMVEESLSKYAEASAKLEKTYIICEVVNHVRKNSPNGGFVKKDPVNGRYFEVGDFLAREKTSQAFRDALHDQYKSSNAAKKKRRISEQAIKLHKQSSAPLLSVSAIQGSSDDIEEKRDIFQQAHNYNLADYVANNSKWMRVESHQDRMGFFTGESNEKNMDLLLGELNLNSSSHGQACTLADKRRLFASQKSATSVVEGVQPSNFPAWSNRSCPNLSGGQTNRPAHRPRPLVQEVIQESDGEIEEVTANDIHCRNVYNDWHHSTPDLYASDQPTHPDNVTSDKPSLLLNRMMQKARSERVLTNTGIRSHFDIYVRPQKSTPSTCTSQTSINHEDLVLSPIGDGSTLDLFDKLQGIEEHFESFVNPLPY